MKGGAEEKEGGVCIAFIVLVQKSALCLPYSGLEYSFSQYDRPSQVYEYTTEDYNNFLQGSVTPIFLAI